MSKLKIDHGISRVRRAKLQASIDQSVADDVQLLAEWSNNEPQYIINQLLRFALIQEEEFQKYKAELDASLSRSASGVKPASSSIKSSSDAVPKSESSSPARV